jgi:HTH-type transcriptional regulator, glycine betaine synthesis regulator
VKRNLVENGAETVDNLNPVELGVTRLFVQLSRALGQPPSVGEIYGLLFISPQPLTMDDLIEHLRLSNGSASQGLKYLRELGAVRIVAVAGARRAHYEAVAELRKLTGNILRQRISPHLIESGNRLEEIAVQAQSLTGEAREHALARITLMKSWEANARRLLPFLLGVLDSQ